MYQQTYYDVDKGNTLFSVIENDFNEAKKFLLWFNRIGFQELHYVREIHTCRVEPMIACSTVYGLAFEYDSKQISMRDIM